MTDPKRPRYEPGQRVLVIDPASLYLDHFAIVTRCGSSGVLVQFDTGESRWFAENLLRLPPRVLPHSDEVPF